MTPTATVDPYPFLRRGGQMGELIRAHDWAASPLGTPDQWPASLRLSVSNMLNTGLPMLVLWGPELICLYNDMVIPSLDPNTQHPAIGKPAAHLWPQAWPVVGPLLEGVLQTGEPITFQDVPMLFYRHGHTEEVFWTFCYSAIMTEDGRIGGVLATCLETTQGVRARQQLEQSQQQLLASFQESPVAIAILGSEQLTIQMANPFYGHLVGRTPDELVGKPLLEALPELAGQGFDQILREVLASGKPFVAHEVAVDLRRTAQLETIYVDLTYQPRRDANEAITGVLVVAVDVTQQVNARKKIEASEARFRSLIQEAPVAMLVYTGPDMVLTQANEKMLAIFGRGEAILGRPILEAIPELVDTPLLAHYRRVLVTGETHHEYAARILLMKQDQPYWGYYDYIYKALRNEQEQVYGVICTALEVTDQVLAQQTIRASEASLQLAIELAQLGTWQIDAATGAVRYSERLQSWLGIQEGILGAEASPRIHAKDRERIRRAIQNALEKGSAGLFDEVYTITHAVTGQDRIIHASGQTVFDAEGNPVSLSGTAQDVTIQQELQLALENEVQTRTEELAASNEELRATNERLATTNDELTESTALLVRSNENLQKFAYVASHDLQEPLRKIQQFGDLLQIQYADSTGEQLDYLGRMQTAASRMSMLIKDLLNFSRISTRRDESKRLPLDEVIRDVLTDLELVITHTNARIEVDSLPQVKGDSAQLTQLFLNLLSNALKFSRVDGAGKPVVPQIAIRYELVEGGELPPSVKPGRFATQYHHITVVDNGIGFDEKYLDRMFQVFQRLHNKTTFAGTGIGLAISEKVVINHGGAITASSQPGQGATFRVYLPAD